MLRTLQCVAVALVPLVVMVVNLVPAPVHFIQLFQFLLIDQLSANIGIFGHRSAFVTAPKGHDGINASKNMARSGTCGARI
jgi:hypothetical protein